MSDGSPHAQRRAQVARLTDYARAGEPVAEITVDAHMIDGIDFNDLPITQNNYTRHYRVISCVWHEWPGFGFVATLGLHCSNPPVREVCDVIG